ncbi:MAG TPA: alpha/beta fold hydrolase [Candidatus Thermoplasmatota archaeon]|nr:alpha/beta fold hydrolase [Candidatus Thermoplasmatota archaeon]
MTRDLRIPATDGFPLAATLYGEPHGARSLVTLNPATAVPRRFYREFAEFLASRGHLVLTFDYRGMGDSRPAKSPRMRDWGDKDLAGVLAWAAKEHPDLPLAGFGHSAGGQMLALAEGGERYQAFVGIAAQSGYWKHWPAPSKYRRALDWHLLMPTTATLFGKVPGWLGLGHDLPRGVALEWARWCRHPDYILSEDHDARAARLAKLTFPLLSYSFADDDYGPQDAADWLAAQFTGARVERRHVEPRELGVKSIGHFGFYRRKQGGALWETTAEWLERHV